MRSGGFLEGDAAPVFRQHRRKCGRVPPPGRCAPSTQFRPPDAGKAPGPLVGDSGGETGLVPIRSVTRGSQGHPVACHRVRTRPNGLKPIRAGLARARAAVAEARGRAGRETGYPRPWPRPSRSRPAAPKRAKPLFSGVLRLKPGVGPCAHAVRGSPDAQLILGFVPRWGQFRRG